MVCANFLVQQMGPGMRAGTSLVHENKRREAETRSAIMSKLNLLIDFLALETTQGRRATKTQQLYYYQAQNSILLLENGKIVKSTCAFSERFMTFQVNSLVASATETLQFLR